MIRISIHSVCISLSVTVIELISIRLFTGLHMSTVCLIHCNQYDDIHYIDENHLYKSHHDSQHLYRDSRHHDRHHPHRHYDDRYYDFL
jgi:hypothetical protein